MKALTKLRRKAARRTTKTKPVYSTTEARANFAEALEAVQLDSAVIGFDRYGRSVAALIPIEAVYMLAGKGGKIDPAARDKIERAARKFVADVPNRIGKRLERKPKTTKSAAAVKKRALATAKAKARRR